VHEIVAPATGQSVLRRKMNRCPADLAEESRLGYWSSAVAAPGATHAHIGVIEALREQ